MTSSPVFVLVQDVTLPESGGVTTWRTQICRAAAQQGWTVETLEWRPSRHHAPRTTSAAEFSSTAAGSEAKQTRVSGAPQPSTSMARRGLGKVLRVSKRMTRRTAKRWGHSPQAVRNRAIATAKTLTEHLPLTQLPGSHAGFAAVEKAVTARPELVPSRILPKPLPGVPEGEPRIVVVEALACATTLPAEHPVAGTRRQRWLLVLPPLHPMPGEPPNDEMLALKRALDKGLIAGLVTDSQPARDVLERALSPLHPPIVVLPPVTDTVADIDAGVVQTIVETSRSGKPLSASDQLTLWAGLKRDHLEQPLTWSFPASRRWGLATCDNREPPTWKFDDNAASDGNRTNDTLADPSLWTPQAQQAGLTELARLTTSPPDYCPGLPHRNVTIAGADHKFIRDLATQLARQPSLSLTLDQWPRWTRHPAPASIAAAAKADVVVCEWVRANAIWASRWASRYKRDDQRLILRLHRFELEAGYPQEVAIEAVDAVVVIAPLFGRRVRDELGWPVEKIVYLPNYIDLPNAERPKLPEARFQLGLGGALPSRKRLDLALDLLIAIRQHDPRFSLSIRTVMPWNMPYVARRPGEMEFYARAVERIETHPLLRGAVSFDGFGADVAAWLRGVGHIISTADSEGSPVVVAEAMASGAVPVVRPWPGAEELLTEWIHPSTEHAADFILESANESIWQTRSEAAKRQVAALADPERVVAGWTALLHGDLAAARSQFREGQLD